MTKLGAYNLDFLSAPLVPLPFDLDKIVAHVEATATQLTATIGGTSLGDPSKVRSAIVAMLYQDDDAHDTCSLTACLNPLHPGPCKGWKGTLHSVAPGAWKQIEAARVEKANAKRLAKIADLKAQGKPIPKKLLAPIVAKPHPNAGKTADGASGGAHDAGKGISQTSGVKVNEAGKIGDGQPPIKLGSDATGAKGPKGKKPTVAGKGIAVVIAQEKVTPQYKLDKAAGITTEQWRALTADEQNIIRGELAKIQKDGFGPQQKKATDLLDKLNKMPEKAPEKPAAAPGKKTLGEATKTVSAPSGEPKKLGTPPATKNTPAAKGPTDVPVADVIHESNKKMAVKAATSGTTDNVLKIAAILTPKQLGELPDADQKKILERLSFIATHPKASAAQKKQASSLLDKLEPKTAKKDESGSFPAPAKAAPASPPSAPANVKTGGEDLTKNGLPTTGKLGSPPATKNPPKIENVAAKPATLPAHVQHAIDMANGKALGATWSKNHLAAYEKLTPEQFHALDADTQSKIVAELKKGEGKFLDLKKIQATKDLLAKFGKGPATDTTPKGATKAAPKADVSFSGDMHDHSVSAADAKKAVEAQPPQAWYGVAKSVAKLTLADNPDSLQHKASGLKGANDVLAMLTKIYTPEVTKQPAVVQAMEDFKAAAFAELTAKSLAMAKESAYNKVSKALYADGSPVVTDKLSPIQKASLQAYKQYLLNHPSKTSTSDLDALTADTLVAKKILTSKLQDALKSVNGPKPEDMTGAQLDSKAKLLLGSDVGMNPAKPKLTLDGDEINQAVSLAEAFTTQLSDKYPADVLNDPAVAAKLGDAKNAAYKHTKAVYEKAHLTQHISLMHGNALASGKDDAGNPLTADDKKIIQLHQAKLEKDYAYVGDNVTALQADMKAASDAFTEAADKALAAVKPPAPVELNDYDKALIPQAYSAAWDKTAIKAVQYGMTFSAQQKMKAHPEYQTLFQDLKDLKDAAGKIALAHAEANTAYQNVPTDPDTGNIVVSSPEWSAWQAKIHAQQDLQKAFNVTYNKAQKRLDTIRVDAGLKKRALPKIDAPAVKAAAAESTYFKTAGYSGPNYGKSAAAKNYLVAKLGSQLGVPHMTAAEKKLGKLSGTLPAGAPAPAAKTTAPAAPVNPVAISGGSSITGIPASTKKQITSDFKSMPTGKYLADPAEDIFDNLVNLAAAHGKNIPGGLSVDQIVKTIDATHAKNLGVSNSGMLEKKITDWLATGAGATYATSHSSPDPKVVKQLLGEFDPPAGVTLAPGEKVQKLSGPGPHDTSIPASAFKKASAASAQASQDKYMQDQGVKWTAKQKAALKTYTGSAYHAMNTYLRKGGSLDASYKQKILEIQSAMMPLQQHTLLKRGTGWDALPPEYHGFDNAKKLIGKTIEEPGFTSSTVAGEGGNFGGALQLEIEAPIGTPAAFVKGISHYSGENEMLLAAGTKFKVLSVTSSGGKTVMRVRIVGDK